MIKSWELGKYFDLRLEIFSLFVPPLFLFLSLVEVFVIIRPTSFQRVVVEFIMDIVFLNALHIVYTFVYLSAVPEFKSYVRLKSLQLKRSLFLEWLCIFIMLFIGFWYYFDGYPLDSQHLSIYAIINIITLTIGMQHIAGQSSGITSLKIFLQKEGARGNVNFSQICKLNVFVKYLSVVAFLFGLIVTNFVSYDAGIAFYFSYILLFLLIFSCAYFVASRNNFPFFIHSFTYSLRYLVYSISTFSYVVNIGRAITHGIESQMIFKKLYPLSNKAERRLKLINPFVLVFIIFGIVSILLNARSGLLGFFTSGLHPKNLIYKFFFSFFHALTFLHFYIENFIYRFSDPLIKCNQGQLFIKPLASYVNEKD